jgi:hypothetical protein
MMSRHRVRQVGLVLFLALLFTLPASATAQPAQVQAPPVPRSNAGAVVPGQYLVGSARRMWPPTTASPVSTPIAPP